MRVGRILKQLCSECVPWVHVVRLRAVLAVLQAIVAGGRLSVTAMGRSIAGRAYAKHSIKRVDRLLSNPRMYRERWLFFRALATNLIGGKKQPVLLVDWTKVADNFYALVAAMPTSGRAPAIYAEVHPESVLGQARVQARFLRNLRDVLPKGCTPTIITDAGFHGPFFREVQALGWAFVGRLRTNGKMSPLGSNLWFSVKDLYSRAILRARDLGTFRLYRTRRRFDVRLVLIRQRRPRVRHPWNGCRAGGGSVSAKTIAGAKSPWLLATSLQCPAARVVKLYSLRMQIEETFRDAKNPRFGWSLRHVRAYRADRLTILLLLAFLAQLAVALIGLAAEACGMHRRYQANTAKTRVLSWFVLGLALIERGDDHRLPGVWKDGLLRLQSLGNTIESHA
jgi:hypothetical protein